MSLSPEPPPRPHHLSRRRLIKTGGIGGLVIGAAGLIESFAPDAHAASAASYTDDGTNYVVNTGANLVFKVNHSNGDLVSLVYRGVEYQGYNGKNSQVEIGLGASAVTIKATSSVIVIKVVHGTLVHYYVARAGENNIYLFSYKDAGSTTMQRFIVRLKPGLLNFTGGDAWDASVSTIESADIFKEPDGTTHAKHYSGVRVKDYDYIGATNSAKTVGVFMVRSNHEKASGGPFYRSLLRTGSTGSPDLYEIVWYGMAQTEAQRWGLHGPYVLSFTDGGAPATSLYARNRDTTWVDSLGLQGWTGAAGRGRVTGVGINGRDSSNPYTVGFASTAAQYWAGADATTGYFSCPGMLPGVYTMTIYKSELAVWAGSVTVTAGGVTALNTITITNDPESAAAIWRIGSWNGTPGGFKNATLMTYAHPSDARAAAWTENFIVGTSVAADFPCYQWNDINNGLIVYFKLTAAQAAAAHSLRIGITASYISGRPQVSVNSWTSAAPAAPASAKTRNLTVGTYREWNTTFTYSIPASAFQTDVTQWNQLKLNIISGSAGDGYLSPGVSYDCLDLLS
ncbi:rhamnogalacturonan lyase B N-terminal domain-containing protein [Actinoplanes sp. NPDC026619]|uniref:rhamnogalacturonan lyase B N-terminal domain-containing protein n=1 Tax=Actinoplanes sp. NPDC026619 TaxID=3155798 RepID=UPI0033C8C560